ncbi:hypothetical protein P7C70_g7753, partial [Phenoliferia sp. Uapishka_3]
MTHQRAPDNCWRPDLVLSLAEQAFLEHLPTLTSSKSFTLYHDTSRSSWSHPDLPPIPPLPPNNPFRPDSTLTSQHCSALVTLNSGRKLFPLQAESVAATLRGQHAFIISATSSGKTAMAYSPLIVLNTMSEYLFGCRAGRQVQVISPRDGNEVQIAAECRGANIHAVAINQTVLAEAKKAKRDLWQEIRDGRWELWCLGPEMNEAVAMEELSKKGSKCLWRFIAWVLDEVHCVSEDVAYRPIYGNVGQLRSKFVRTPPIPWLALTATATRIIKGRITLALGWKNVFFRQQSNQRRIKFLVGLLEDGPKSVAFSELDWVVGAPDVGNVIIFVDDIHTINNLVLYLRGLLGPGRSAYEVDTIYASLSAEHKAEVEGRQRSGVTRVLIASSILEMGTHLEFDWGVQYGLNNNNDKLTGTKFIQRVGRVGRRIIPTSNTNSSSDPLQPPTPSPPLRLRPPPRFIMYVNAKFAGHLRTAKGPIPKSHLVGMQSLDDIMRGFLYANCRHRGVNVASENPEDEWMELESGECCDLCDKRDGLVRNKELSVRVSRWIPAPFVRPLRHPAIDSWKLDGNPTLRALVLPVARDALEVFRVRARFCTPELSAQSGISTSSVFPQHLFEAILSVFTDIQTNADLTHHLDGRWSFAHPLQPLLFTLISSLNEQFNQYRPAYTMIEKQNNSRKAPVVRVRTEAQEEAEDGCDVAGLGVMLTQLGTYDAGRKKKQKRVKAVGGDAEDLWMEANEEADGAKGPPWPPHAEFRDEDFDWLFEELPFTKPNLKTPFFNFASCLSDPHTPIHLVAPPVTRPPPLRLPPPKRPPNRAQPIPPPRAVLGARSSNIMASALLQPAFRQASLQPKRKLRENATPGDRAEKTPRSPASNVEGSRAPPPIFSYAPGALRSPVPPRPIPSASDQAVAEEFLMDMMRRG